MSTLQDGLFQALTHLTGPLLAVQAFNPACRLSLFPSFQRQGTGSPLSWPSLASSPPILSQKVLNNDIASLEEGPVAGDGFETVNGYGSPFATHLPGSYEAATRVKGIAFARKHWSGKVVGDRVVASQSLIGRMANMMSPKPKLQVQPPHTDSQREDCHMPGHLSVDWQGVQDEAESTQVLDISATSDTPPSLTNGEDRIWRTAQSSRRIGRICEVDSIVDSLSSEQPRLIEDAQSSPNHLRKRRATIDNIKLSSSDYLSWVEASRRIGQDHAIATGRSTNMHRCSISLSLVHAASPTSLDLASNADSSCSGQESPGNMTAGSSIPSLSDSEPRLVEATREWEEEYRREALSPHDCSKNWSLVDRSPVSAQGLSPSSPALSRSLAEVMGISSEGEYNVATLGRSTPLRAVSTSESRSTSQGRKSLCSEMGFGAVSSPVQHSPCRTFSDQSSLAHRRVTADSNCESFLSSGVDEEFIISPDCTLERITRIEEEIEREIVIIEMEEENSSMRQRGTTSGEDASDDASSSQVNENSVSEAPCFPFSTTYFGPTEPTWLDPVEEVTEEPTIPLSVSEGSVGDETVGSIACSPATTPRLIQRSGDEWAKLHGFATPSSLALSTVSPSHFGWAEVFVAGRKEQELALCQRHRHDAASPTSTTSGSPLSRYLASRLAGTPSRLIGLHSHFWTNSPLHLSLEMQNLLQTRRTTNNSMLSHGTDGDDSDWVDGALGKSETHQAQQHVDRNEKRWKRMSRSIQRLSAESSESSPVRIAAKAATSKRRSSASLQSFLDSAVRAPFRAQQTRASSCASSTAKLSSRPAPLEQTESKGTLESWQNGTESSPQTSSKASNPPSTPRRGGVNEEVMRASSARAPTKSGGSRTSALTSGLESPSNGKGKRSPSKQGALARHGSLINRRSPGCKQSPGSKTEYRVQGRKESVVRERVKLLESVLKATMEHNQSSPTRACLQSPQKKSTPRE